MAEPSEFMRVALAAARAARGTTSPNPWVGAVVVRGGQVISSGATSPYGGPHAEAAALANVDARGATLYTTLEPCMPFAGKRTPPCTQRILEAGVSKVVVALEDPHAPVRGQGVAWLREKGIEVEAGDGEAAAVELLRPYLKFRHSGKPYVIAKFAISLDGKAGAPAAGITWLTGPTAIERAHADRAWVDAIMVGSGTVLADNPALTARPASGTPSRQPLRVVLDGRGRSDPAARVLGAGALVATGDSAAPWQDAIRATGATLVHLEGERGGLNLEQLFRALGQRSVVSLIAEGGPALHRSLFEGGFVDEVHAYVAPIILGEPGIPLFPAGDFAPVRLRDVVLERLEPDVLIRGYTGEWSPLGEARR